MNMKTLFEQFQDDQMIKEAFETMEKEMSAEEAEKIKQTVNENMKELSDALVRWLEERDDGKQKPPF